MKKSKTLMQAPGENQEVCDKVDSSPIFSPPATAQAPLWRAAK